MHSGGVDMPQPSSIATFSPLHHRIPQSVNFFESDLVVHCFISSFLYRTGRISSLHLINHATTCDTAERSGFKNSHSRKVTCV